MRLDSEIVEYIIKDFIKSNTPILTVHDSFVVPFGQEDRLDKLMKEAFFTITKQKKVNIKYNQNITEKALYASQHQDRNFYLDTISFLKEGNPSMGYSNRLKQHNRWINLKI